MISIIEDLQPDDIERYMKIKKKYINQLFSNEDISLNRNIREFKTLKRNYIHLDIKEGFMDALLMGRPHFQEDSHLDQAQMELNDVNNQLSIVKNENREHNECLFLLIDELFDRLKEFDIEQENVHRGLIDLCLEQKTLAIYNICKMVDSASKDLNFARVKIYTIKDCLVLILRIVCKGRNKIENFKKQILKIDSLRTKISSDYKPKTKITPFSISDTNNMHAISLLKLQPAFLVLDLITQPINRSLSSVTHRVTINYSERKKLVISAHLQPRENIDMKKVVAIANCQKIRAVSRLIIEIRNLLDKKINGELFIGQTKI